MKHWMIITVIVVLAGAEAVDWVGGHMERIAEDTAIKMQELH